MPELKKILIAEDELTNSLLLKRLLTKAGYSVVIAHNGVDALKHLGLEKFDVLLTDWMMPQMDGIELIRRTRQDIFPIPLIIMITALVSEHAKNYSLESGADDYIAKPIDIEELLTRVKDNLSRKSQKVIVKHDIDYFKKIDGKPPLIAVIIATSTGGPPTLIQLFKDIGNIPNVAYYLVQHGPPWMLEAFAKRLQNETNLRVQIAIHGMRSESGNIYIAPGDNHMRIEQGTFNILIDNGPKENFVRPAADPLLRSAAEVFGNYCIAVILTGLGRDGAQGASQVASANGVVLVQDPETAIAPSMPRTVIESGIKHRVVPISQLTQVLTETATCLSSEITK